MSTLAATASQSQLVALVKTLTTRSNIAKLIGAYVLWTIFKYRNTAYGVKLRSDVPPSPRGIPLLGHLHYALIYKRNQVLQRQLASFRRFGKTYSLTFPGTGRIIYANDPEILDHVLRTNFWAYEKGPFIQNVLFPLIGNGIFGADGEHWRWQRKIASHVFNVKSFREYTTNVFCTDGEAVCDLLSKAADNGNVVDLQDVFYRFTLESFGEIAFGMQFGCLKDPDNELEFAKAFDRLNFGLSGRLIASPFMRLKDWWTGITAQLQKDEVYVREFAYDVIRKRRNSPELRDRRDLMALFMNAKDENNEPLSDEMLKDMLLNFVIAGRDTTAQALSWMFYLMHRSTANKEILGKLVDETEEVLGGEQPTYESTRKQKYAEACFYEALRLYPSVPKNIKVCVEDDVWPDGTTIKKGEFFGWAPWAMGRTKEVWGEDAEVYKPERWLTGDRPSPSKFPAFHVGPRTCLGQQFATIEAIALMSMLFQRFEFELVDPDTEPDYTPGLTLPLEKGLPIRVHHRKNVSSKPNGTAQAAAA
ncbi:Protein kinase alk2 [Actinomortierella ambigua]|nr:Protein kinase alk2 [Actinomortierella ambigua]